MNILTNDLFNMKRGVEKVNNPAEVTESESMIKDMKIILLINRKSYMKLLILEIY